MGLERHIETPATVQARKDESRLVAVVFAIVVVAMPLLTIAWSKWGGPARRQAAQTSPPAELATPTDSTSVEPSLLDALGQP